MTSPLAIPINEQTNKQKTTRKQQKQSPEAVNNFANGKEGQAMNY